MLLQHRLWKKVTPMDEAVRAAIRADFQAFSDQAFAELHNDEMMGDDPYIGVVYDFVTGVWIGEASRGIINLPPRHLKTILCTVCLSAWELAHKPASKIIIVTYGEDLSRNIAAKVRRILESDWYQETFATRLSGRSATDMTTDQGGELFAVSIGGAITGRGADLIIIDDPVKISDANNATAHERAITVCEEEVFSRLNDPQKGRILVVSHRLNEADLSGHLLSGDPAWRKLVLPLVADDSVRILPSWFRHAGDLLRFDSFSNEQLTQLRARRDFETLYQQNPGRRAWGMLTEDHFPTYSFGLPAYTTTIVSIDPSQEEGGDPWVMQAWKVGGGAFVLLDQWRQNSGYSTLSREVLSFLRTHQPAVTLVESAGVGTALADQIARRNFEVERVTTGPSSKIERLQRHMETITAGKVQIAADAAIRRSFLDEILQFPNGQHDDQVDAMTQLLDWAGRTLVMPPPRRRAVVFSAGAQRGQGNGTRGSIGASGLRSRK